jgi:serine/threonine-protein kinase
MYEAEASVVKVTDFGIARITDSSKTKTGMVLGAPSYMSPEQLPFAGESMASLMFKIANEPHVSTSTINTMIPPCLATIIDRMLEKSADKRYTRGQEIADELKVCAEQAM